MFEAHLGNLLRTWKRIKTPLGTLVTGDQLLEDYMSIKKTEKKVPAGVVTITMTLAKNGCVLSCEGDAMVVQFSPGYHETEISAESAASDLRWKMEEFMTDVLRNFFPAKEDVYEPAYKAKLEAERKAEEKAKAEAKKEE